ncbi:hypothetical protein I6N98_00340 [Spongiibacter nanhainus]|uniref:Uncharacterized protein n=1 Tax=Spongiibacter nanhainus TaxID=2794344 RepID=A0A7T4UQ42_9GAMM|nr:hypothetical protein [Spongiibacter nanhainus]QQD18363.1 hypothetical protein I6N98_00340 [Spongiibacter nanhainus]
MRVFVFSTDDLGLEVFDSKQDAIDACEGIDVENGECLFWDEHGIGLKAEFSTPNKKGSFTVVSGTYDLVPFPEGLELVELLPKVGYVEGHGHFKDVTEIKQFLTRP